MTIASERTDPLVAAAEAGDTHAQFRLAEALRKGEGARQDLEAARHWYRAAAEQGHADAQNNLGSMYLNATGTPRNVDEAIRWYRAAAEQGQADAALNLGTRYRLGEGVAQDFSEALAWFLRAAESGSLEAICDVGTAYRFGHGVAQSFEEAAAWHVDAAELGDVVAMGNLSDYREDLERLALDGSLTATHFLARMYERGLAVEQDNAILYAWVRWGARECGPRVDDDLRASLPACLALLEQDLPAADQERGLATLAVFEAARDALHRDWGKRPA